MPNLLPPEFSDIFITFFFVYVRVVTMIFVMPAVSNQTVFSPVRIGLSFWITILLLGPELGVNEGEITARFSITQEEINGLIGFTLALICEIMIGFMLGFIGQILLVAISISGEIIGQQAGFSAASVLDPVTGQDAFLMATVKLWIGTIIFIVIGGIESGFQILGLSFQVVTPGAGFDISQFGDAGYQVFNWSESGPGMKALGSMMYLFGVQIAAPMITTMVLISVSEAFIARTVPQLNILVVGFALRISIGLFLLHNMMSFTTEKFHLHMDQYTDYALAALSHLQGS